LDRLRENLRSLLTGIEGSDLHLLEVEGGWYATLRVPRVQTEEQWMLQLLETSDVLIQPGYFYDFDSEAFLVLSLLTLPEVFREGVARIVDYAGMAG
ncbi:MAG: pyridoxal phosphate-dependent aminotransferase, partial [Acidobacteriota bacterium]|nr:pyridoxal phosphate-dependent aminotransferase [Acidobacteriota bacterium]